ncbi:uncharacterized protein LOC114519818 [Dendronephthya gigantea]|uniref:uncharacterized protein LOC114519818 n=1 Tax=Dendronephthya gigantea TaxID=151771 RepID=UPI00106CC7A9|nr:uncharacterized protein LOC114519818 [Dendronephthya gigantea]
MEMGEPVMSRKFRRTSSINRGRENIDSDQTGYKKGRDFGQSTRNEGFTDVVPRDPVVLLSYRQSRDENGSYRPRVDRREYGTNVYQDSFREEEIPAFRKTRRESDFSREVLRERMQMRSGEELRRSESLPHRASKNIPENTYPRRVYYSATRAKKSHPRNLKTNSLRGPERRESERRDDRQPYNVRESRAPERRSQFPDRSDSDVVKPRQQSSDKTNTYPRTRSRDSPEKYFADRSQRQMVEPTSQSDTESDDSDMSQKASFRDNQNAAYSDNDLIAKRAKRFREKRFLDDWDTRSVKSVAF